MLFLLVLFIPYCLISQDIRMMAVIFSLLLIVDILLNYSKQRKVSYLDIWNLGFLFMVTSEMILSSQLLALQENGLTAVRYILAANVLFNIGFRIVPFFSKTSRHMVNRATWQVVTEKKIMWFLLFLAIVYFVSTIQQAFTVFALGRHNFLEDTVSGEINILGRMLIGISYFTPITAAFYFRYYLQYKQRFLLVLIILLCAIPQVFLGTRYLLLFSLVAPLIVLFDRRKISPKIIFGGFAIIFSIISLTGFIRQNRNVTTTITLSETRDKPLVEQIAKFGSNENLVKRTDLLFKYTENHGLHYGKESAFIFYFWIPRNIWPEKPTKLSHWLVNKYETVSRTYSAAYGFWGELFIDFGYFSLVIIFFLGGIIRRLDEKKDRSLNDRSKISILYITLFPVLFFSVRSPQTALINFVLVALVYIILSYLFKKIGLVKNKKIIRISESIS